jgi:hypothetical protein
LTPDDIGNTSLGYFSPQEPGSFRKMLYSVLQQLESTSRDARQDAYLAINGALKTYDNIPGVAGMQALVDQMGRVTQFLSRDMCWKDAAGRLDSIIVVQAIRLTCAIMLNPQSRKAIDQDFQAFVIDRSTFVLEQLDMPKSVVKGHLQLLCMQRSSPDIMTSARADKLVNVLQKIESRNSMIVARLIIYQRLVEQAPATMLNRMRDWIEHVFHGVLSSITDVQRRAIDTFTQVGMLLGNHPQTAKIIHEICERDVEEGQSYVDYLSSQLLKIMADKEKAAVVPEIWTAVVLCFRTKRRPVTVWPRFKGWLLLLQKCLNSSDMAIKRSSNIAWNRLVFTILPDSTVSETMRSMLKVPIVTGLERRGNGEYSQQLRQLALDSYCNLLHYSLRPELPVEELDLAWDMYVGPVLTNLANHNSKGSHIACQILHGLLQKSSGVWNVNAAIEPTPIRPEDLPGLDVRWVRSRAEKFIQVLEPLLIASMRSTSTLKRAIDETWRLFLQAISEASSQEIKSSNELKVAIAQLTNLFRRLWATSSSTDPDYDVADWLSRYQSLLKVTIDLIGTTQFQEDILVRTGTEEVEVAPTPSHRTSKKELSLCSPFAVLFSLHYQPHLSSWPAVTCEASAVWLLRLLEGPRSSISGNLGMLHKMLQFCSAWKTKSLMEIHSRLWNAVADHVIDLLRTQSSLSPRRGTAISTTTKPAIKILLEGLQYWELSDECRERVLGLYATICDSTKLIAGKGAVILGVMEPLATALIQGIQHVRLDMLVDIVTSMMHNAVWISTKNDLDQPRHITSTAHLLGSKVHTHDPYDYVYTLVNSVLDQGYNEFSGLDPTSIQALVECMSSVVGFLRRCPETILQTCLRRLQPAFVPWIEDKHRSAFPLSGDQDLSMQTQIHDTWAALVVLLRQDLVPKDSRLLETLEPLWIAAFSSPSRTIVNEAIVFWKSHFSDQNALEYPANLVPVLRARQIQTDLVLPSLGNASDGNAVASLPTFADSQSNSPLAVPTSVTPKQQSRHASENIFIRQHLQAESLVSEAVEGADVGTPSARPRHDDSQVNFAPISASSKPAILDSQLMTEHQREVRSRQEHDANLYPDLSSSPITATNMQAVWVSKKLDFTPALSSNDDEDTMVTPTGPADNHTLHDDLPSSPTPRASGTVGTLVQDSELDESTEVDLPSSPPETSDDAAAVDIEYDMPDVTKEDAMSMDEDEASNIQTTDMQPNIETSDLPSDTPLPNDQLAQETEMATPAKVPGDVEWDSDNEDQQTATPSDAGTSDSRSLRATKKRKRSSDTVFTAKKRKPQSPFNKFMSRIFSQGKEDDIEEEIVVSPARLSAADSTEYDEEHSVQSGLESQDSYISQDGPPETQAEKSPKVPGRRKRGKPRKAQVQLPPIAAVEHSGPKRRASALDLDDGDDQMDMSRVEDTPLLTRSMAARSATDRPGAPGSQGSTGSERSATRARSTRSALRDGQENSAESRPMAQPRSIIGKLRGILADCKNMILGSVDEQRQFDDVLFEIRREVHEAGRRD